MTANRLLALSVAIGALVSSAPASAQSASTYENAEPQTECAIVYQNDPVIQALPGAAIPEPAPAPVIAEERVVEVAPPAATHTHSVPAASSPYPAVSYPSVSHHSVPAYANGYPYPVPPHANHYPTAFHFDRDAWLADCRERIRGVDRKDRAGVIGGLLGAVAGGLIGNRVWDSQRLGGTLLGAGLGGLAGAAAGSAIGAAGDRRSDDECALYLDRHTASGHPGYGHPSYGYAYGYGYPAVAYIPVMAQVPQRAIVREYVTEEWIDVPAEERSTSTTQTRIIRQPAPAQRGDKRVKLIKGK